MEGDEETIQEKIDSLMRYRNDLNESDRELFDALMAYANEVAISMDGACTAASRC
jgi:hypothetical protein